MPKASVTNMTIVGPEEESKKKLAYIPEKEATQPIIIDKNITLEKLFESMRAEIAGPTITEASNVTPIDDIETIITVARTNENSNSICDVLIPLILALSLSKNEKTSRLCKKKKNALERSVTETITYRSCSVIAKIFPNNNDSKFLVYLSVMLTSNTPNAKMAVVTNPIAASGLILFLLLIS